MNISEILMVGVRLFWMRRGRCCRHTASTPCVLPGRGAPGLGLQQRGHGEERYERSRRGAVVHGEEG